MILHACGIVLIAARTLHAYGLSRTGGTSPERFAGTGLTWLVMLAMALLLIWQQLIR